MRNTLPEVARTGWSIQVYSGDRRLLCSFEPSHAWLFAAGFGAGFLLALLSTGHLHAPTTVSESPAADAINAPFDLD